MYHTLYVSATVVVTSELHRNFVILLAADKICRRDRLTGNVSFPSRQNSCIKVLYRTYLSQFVLLYVSVLFSYFRNAYLLETSYATRFSSSFYVRCIFYGSGADDLALTKIIYKRKSVFLRNKFTVTFLVCHYFDKNNTIFSCFQKGTTI